MDQDSVQQTAFSPFCLDSLEEGLEGVDGGDEVQEAASAQKFAV